MTKKILLPIVLFLLLCKLGFGWDTKDSRSALLDQWQGIFTEAQQSSQEETSAPQAQEDYQEETPVSRRQTSVSQEQIPAPQEKAAMPQEQTSVSKEQTAASKEPTSIPQEHSSVSEQQAPISKEQTLPSKEPAPASQEQPPVSQEQTSLSKEQASVSHEQPPVSQEQSVTSQKQQEQTPTSQERVPVVKEQIAVSKEPTAASPQQPLPSQRQASMSQEQTAASKEQTEASKELAPAPQEQAPVSHEQSSVPQKQTAVSQEQAPISKEQTLPSKEPAPASQEQPPVSQEQTSVAKEQIAASKETAPVPQELASMSPEQGPVLQEKEPASQDKASASQEQIPVSKEQTSVSKEPVSASQEQALVSQEQLPLSEVSPQIQSETSVQSAPVQKTDETRPPAESPAANKISLDIKGMDVVDVLKMLAQRANLNIVVGKNVTGRVTLFLKDTEPWDAFEIVILGNDLAYQKQGEIINIMTQRDYELQYGERFQDKKQAKIIKLRYAKAADLAKALNQIKTNVGKIVVDDGSNTVVIIDVPEKLKEMKEFIKKTDLPLQTQVFSLNYAAAEKLSPKLQEAITKGVGSLRIDERSNRIVVTDYPRSLAAISEIIKAFDDKTPQVLIDAQIIEIKPSDKFEMGVDWDYWIKTHFRTSLSLPINKTNALILSTATSTPTNPGDYKGIIDILRTIGDTKILSSPRIMVLNNQEAKILVGTKDAYITSSVTQTTGTAVTADTVNFVESGIKMFVTPTVNRDGFVTMKIKPEVSSAEVKSLISQDKKTDVPIITSSEAETTVMVKDGVTIIIGGLRRDRKLETVKKVPILGDLPGLRYFFSSTSIQIDKADLIILLTPHVMSGENSYTAFSEIKPRNGAVVDMRNGEIIEEKITAKPKTNLVPANAKK